MGPGFTNGIAEGFLILIFILILISTACGYGIRACTTKVGHPTISWSR